MTQVIESNPDLPTSVQDNAQRLDCPYGDLASPEAWSQLLHYLYEQGVIRSLPTDQPD